eukprot:COSAG02_NODE_28706_length_584_cov_0.849485_2_plen_88_part_01
MYPDACTGCIVARVHSFIQAQARGCMRAHARLACAHHFIMYHARACTSATARATTAAHARGGVLIGARHSVELAERPQETDSAERTLR